MNNLNENPTPANLTNKRKSGILLHISSLPGQFGIGDFGIGSDNFIRFLTKSGQQLWQVLPLNITSSEASHSPYSALSAFAGNPLFIDPWKMRSLGLLSKKDIRKYHHLSQSIVDFKLASKSKYKLLEKAYKEYNTSESPLQKAFYGYKNDHKHWLNDFAVFMCLKDEYNGIPWSQWPKKFQYRNSDAVSTFVKNNTYRIDYIKFIQFIFDQQWMHLKGQANQAGIEIFGDMPIYVSYDSADVWSNPEMFMLNNDLSMASVAGVPPDYFNADGQRWGMPLFQWDLMEKDKYDWWIRRIGRNLQWFDLLRLDHFRGFSSYWEIPADEETAKNGKWQPGPGPKLFDAVLKAFPRNPFVAEDLGMIDKDVYDLRDKYRFPGMRVAQFGFGGEISENIHHPANYEKHSIAYTGTHDNNTTLGWYRNDLNDLERTLIRESLNVDIDEKNVAREMINIVMRSDSDTSVIPMQDWLNLDQQTRMNQPSTTTGNWMWKLKNSRILSRKMARRIRRITIETERHL